MPGQSKIIDDNIKFIYDCDLACTCRSLGKFTSAEHAARQYDREAIDLYGDTACLNFNLSYHGLTPLSPSSSNKRPPSAKRCTPVSVTGQPKPQPNPRVSMPAGPPTSGAILKAEPQKLGVTYASSSAMHRPGSGTMSHPRGQQMCDPSMQPKTAHGNVKGGTYGEPEGLQAALDCLASFAEKEGLLGPGLGLRSPASCEVRTSKTDLKPAVKLHPQLKPDGVTNSQPGPRKLISSKPPGSNPKPAVSPQPQLEPDGVTDAQLQPGPQKLAASRTSTIDPKPAVMTHSQPERDGVRNAQQEHGPQKLAASKPTGAVSKPAVSVQPPLMLAGPSNVAQLAGIKKSAAAAAATAGMAAAPEAAAAGIAASSIRAAAAAPKSMPQADAPGKPASAHAGMGRNEAHAAQHEASHTAKGAARSHAAVCPATACAAPVPIAAVLDDRHVGTQLASQQAPLARSTQALDTKQQTKQPAVRDDQRLRTHSASQTAPLPNSTQALDTKQYTRLPLDMPPPGQVASLSQPPLATAHPVPTQALETRTQQPLPRQHQMSMPHPQRTVCTASDGLSPSPPSLGIRTSRPGTSLTSHVHSLTASAKSLLFAAGCSDDDACSETISDAGMTNGHDTTDCSSTPRLAGSPISAGFPDLAESSHGSRHSFPEPAVGRLNIIQNRRSIQTSDAGDVSPPGCVHANHAKRMDASAGSGKAVDGNRTGCGAGLYLGKGNLARVPTGHVIPGMPAGCSRPGGGQSRLDAHPSGTALQSGLVMEILAKRTLLLTWQLSSHLLPVSFSFPTCVLCCKSTSIIIIMMLRIE